jgi:GNAT superfamily N-acetyltransferase
MTAGDVEPAFAASQAAFEARGERWPMTSEPADVRWRRGIARIRHLLERDPAGAWVADDGGAVRGVSMALVREDVWGLSLLAVEPGVQGTGIGGRLLEHALVTAEGTRGQIILSSLDPRAMRSYAGAGFALRPAVCAFGAVRRAAIPEELGVRPGGNGDLELAAEVDRRQRGGAHGPDLEALRAAGYELLVLPGEGYAFHREGSPALLAAAGADAGRALLWAVLAASAPGREVGVMFLTEDQGWAIDVALAAGLDLEPCGPTFVRGELGPLSPYLPNPAYL